MLQSEPAPKAGSESDGVELEIAEFVGDESAAPVSEVPADQLAQEEETPAANYGQGDGGNDTAASDSEDETLLKLVTDAVRVCLFFSSFFFNPPPPQHTHPPHFLWFPNAVQQF
jgi:hypothetical protein